ncbi:unnamed protein product [Caenorhabditis nigoni]
MQEMNQNESDKNHRIFHANSNGPTRESTIRRSQYVARQLLHQHNGDTTRARHKLFRELQDLPAVHHRNANEVEAYWHRASAIFMELRNLDPVCDNTTTADIISRQLRKSLLELLHQYIKADSLVITICNDNAPTARSSTTMSIYSGRNTRSPTRQAVKSFKTPCAFCSDARNIHRHEDCPAYEDTDSKKRIAQGLSLCFKDSRSDRSQDGRQGQENLRGQPNNLGQMLLGTTRLTRLLVTTIGPANHSTTGEFNSPSHKLRPVKKCPPAGMDKSTCRTTRRLSPTLHLLLSSSQ